MRTSLAIKAFATSFGVMLVSLIVAIISTPLFLTVLGDERVGAFRVLTDWAAYLLLIELGLSDALRARFAKSIATSQVETENVFDAGVINYRRITVLVLIVALGFGFVLPWVVPVSYSLQYELLLAWTLMSFTALALLLGTVRPLLEGMQRAYSINYLLMLQPLTATGVGLYLAWQGWGIASQAMGTFVATAILAFGLYRCLAKTVPQFCRRLLWPEFNLREKKRLSQLNLPTFACRISGQVGMLSDNIIIGFLLGPTSVVPFFLTQRIALVAQGFLQSFSGSSWAALADLHHRQQSALFQLRVIELTRLIAIFSVLVLAPILIYNRYFLSLWVGSTRYGGELATLLSVCNAFLISILSLWIWLFAGTEKIGLIAPVSVVSAVVNVAISFVATYWLGIVGPLIGTLVALVAVQGTWLPHLLRVHFGIVPNRLFFAMAYPWFLASPFIALAWWLVRKFPSLQPSNWIELSVSVGLMLALLLVFQWRCCLDAENRYLWRRRVLDFTGVGF